LATRRNRKKYPKADTLIAETELMQIIANVAEVMKVKKSH